MTTRCLISGRPLYSRLEMENGTCATQMALTGFIYTLDTREGLKLDPFWLIADARKAKRGGEQTTPKTEAELGRNRKPLTKRNLRRMLAWDSMFWCGLSRYYYRKYFRMSFYTPVGTSAGV